MALKKFKLNAKKTDSTPLERAGHVALGIGGGKTANALTTWLEKQTWLGPAAPHAAAIPALVGAAMYVLIPPTNAPMRLAGSFGLGMAITSGTEEVEGLMGMLQGALGMSDQQMGLSGSQGKRIGQNISSRLGLDVTKTGNFDRPVFVGGTAIN